MTVIHLRTKLRFPAALPNIFGGLKVASTLAVIGATIGEWVGASAGLGYLMAEAIMLSRRTCGTRRVRGARTM